MNMKFENKKEWQESNELVIDIYKLMSGLPKEEYDDPFSLSNEIKNTAISIPSNLSSIIKIKTIDWSLLFHILK